MPMNEAFFERPRKLLLKTFLAVLLSCIIGLLLVAGPRDIGINPFTATCSRAGGFKVSYTFEPRLENSKRPFLIIVKSAVTNFDQRVAVRETWARNASELGIPVIFAVGLPKREEDEKKLRLEAHIFDDILQANFLDNYYNLTLKTYTILAWSSACARLTESLFVVDDDAIVFPENLFQFEENRYWIIGHCWSGIDVMREGKNKVDVSLWPEAKWPPFCSGGAGHLLSGEIARKLAQHFESTASWFIDFQPFPEDVVFTGIVREAIGNVSLRERSDVFQLGPIQGFPGCESRTVSIHRYSPAEYLRWTWRTWQEELRRCPNRS